MIEHAAFYRAFEDIHRGSRELIQSRLEPYLPLMTSVAALHPGTPAIDLGCGRGEWLELLARSAVPAEGVDLDEGMLKACRERHLDVRRQDALEYLRGLPDASRIAVTGFHIAEHLPFDLLQALVAQALRVLKPAGLLILETPNPENLAVGTAGFYMDPTHVRPLPAPLLAFLPRFHGFARTHVMRLQEGPPLRGAGPVTLIDVLAGVSPDYGVVAQKQADERCAGHPAAAVIDAEFASQRGVTLNELAERHERQWAAQVREAREVAEAARGTVVSFQARHLRMLERLGDLEKTLADRLATLEQDIAAIHASPYWKIRAPLRWLSAQYRALREQGASERGRKFAAKARSTIRTRAIGLLNAHPRARAAMGSAARKLGLGRWVDRLRSGSPEVVRTDISAAARRVHAALKHAVQRGRERKD